MARNAKKFLVLDCETATIPQVSGIELTPEQKQLIGVTKPIIYDLGYKIIDRSGYCYKSVSYVIADCYYDIRLFETAYYANKRPLYEQAIADGTMKVKTWKEAYHELLADMQQVEFIAAYNAAFDFKKAVPFTAYYFRNRNHKWFKGKMADFVSKIAAGDKSAIGNNPNYLNPEFIIREGETVPIVDIMPLVLERVCNTRKYRKWCIDNGELSASGKYFSGRAESVYRYISGNTDFDEDHTALADVEIEAEMLLKCLAKGKPIFEIGCFGARNLGTVKNFKAVNGYDIDP